MYKIVMRGCGLLAGTVAVVYITTLWVASIDGPAGFEVSARVGAIAASVAVLGGVLSVAGWMIRSESRASSSRIATEVSLTVAGVLEQRLHKVAETTAGRSHDSLVEVMHELTDGLRADVETWLGRAHTRGMVDEAGHRGGNGSVASINSRRDT